MWQRSLYIFKVEKNLVQFVFTEKHILHPSFYGPMIFKNFILDYRKDMTTDRKKWYLLKSRTDFLHLAKEG